jgi:glycerol-3-phosphate cytidylyltransferase-like family protein
LRLIEEARTHGEHLCVIVANDEQAHRKRPFIFMSAEQRKAIMESIKGVNFAVISIDSDTNVCQTLKMLRPNVFVSGCDKDHPDAIEERKVCDELGIKTIYNAGGGKIMSSSELLNNYVQNTSK